MEYDTSHDDMRNHIAAALATHDLAHATGAAYKTLTQGVGRAGMVTRLIDAASKLLPVKVRLALDAWRAQRTHTAVVRQLTWMLTHEPHVVVRRKAAMMLTVGGAKIDNSEMVCAFAVVHTVHSAEMDALTEVDNTFASSDAAQECSCVLCRADYVRGYATRSDTSSKRRVH